MDDVRPGSGIFFDLGKTLAIVGEGGYRAACRKLGGTACDNGGPSDQHEELLRVARQRGLDSVQLLGTRPGCCRARKHFEIVSVKSNCDAHVGPGLGPDRDDHGACPLPGVLTHGRAGRPCVCNASHNRINCH